MGTNVPIQRRRLVTLAFSVLEKIREKKEEIHNKKTILCTWIINPGRRSRVILVLDSDCLSRLGVGRVTNFQIVPSVDIHLSRQVTFSENTFGQFVNVFEEKFLSHCAGLSGAGCSDD